MMGLIRGLSALLIAIALAGCSPVKPWQRGNLAKADMAWTPDPMGARLQNHVYFAKEASSGGGKAAGGGCGCN